MAYQARSLKKIISELLSQYQELQPDLETVPGNPGRDLAVDLPAIELHRLEVLVSYLSYLSTVTGMQYILDSTSFQFQILDALGMNPDTSRPYTAEEVYTYITEDIHAAAKDHHVTPLGESYARGMVRFYFSTNDPVTIASGTRIVYPRGNVVFRTTQAITEDTPIQIVANRKYEMPVTVQCVTSGPDGNLRDGKYFELENGSLANLTSITNTTSFKGGYNAETNQHLLTRLKSAKAGGQIPQRGGYENFAYSYENVRDVLIRMPEDDDSLLPGEVEIFVLVDDEEIQRETRVMGTGTIRPLRKQPSVRVLSITDEDGNAYTLGADFAEDKDTGIYARSIQGGDRFAWIDTGDKPTNGKLITIKHTVNKTVRQMQEALNNGGAYDVAGNAIIKESPRVHVYIGISNLVLENGFELEEVKNNIWNDLNDFFAGSKDFTMEMGQTIAASEVVDVIQESDGVDYFDIPLTKFYGVLEGENAEESVATVITTEDTEHLVLGQIFYS